MRNHRFFKRYDNKTYCILLFMLFCFVPFTNFAYNESYYNPPIDYYYNIYDDNTWGLEQIRPRCTAASSRQLLDLDYYAKPYSRVEDNLVVKKYSTYTFDQRVVIEDIKVNNNLVYIGKNAFKNCVNLQTIFKLSPSTSVSIEVADSAFMNCTSLKSINDNEYGYGNYPSNYILGNYFNSIGKSCFEGCTKLNNVTIVPIVRFIGQNAFKNCSSLKNFTFNATSCSDCTNPVGSVWSVLGVTNLTSLIIGDNVKRIPSHFITNAEITGIEWGTGIEEIAASAFEGSSITNPQSFNLTSLKTIGAKAFNNSSIISTLTIPAGVVSIGENAFSNSSSIDVLNFNATDVSDFNSSASKNPFYGSAITTANIGNYVKIPKYFALGVSSIKKVTIGNNITHIPISAFQNCTGITSITFPSTLSEIGNNAFNGCTSITTISLPSSIQSLGNNVFYGCSALKSITIPNSIVNIGSNVFNGCANLTSISLPSSLNTISDYAFANCTKLTKIKIPNQNVGHYSFANCSKISEITLENTVKKIEANAFANNTSLNKVICNAVLPPDVSASAFSGINVSSVVLEVPLAALNAYSTHDVWSQFNIVPVSGSTQGSGGFPGSGAGTSSDPYLIFNPIQLYSVRNFTGYEGVVFKLMSDIDLTEFLQDNNPTQGWEPIGVQNSPFKGVFYGQNHKITGLFMNRTSDFGGFWGYTVGANIQDLTLEGGTMKGGSYSGAFCGVAQSSYFTGVSSSNNVEGKSYTGGFVGLAIECTLNDCHHVGSVTATDSISGGFAGNLKGSIVDASHNGNVNGKKFSGGFVGVLSGTLNNATCNANVTGNDYTGGFVGKNSAVITIATSSGNVAGSNYTGGFAGDNTEQISNANATSSSVTGGERTGGFAGHNTASLTNVTSTGQTVSGGNYTGGFVGDNNGNITDATSTLTSVSGGQNDVAGFAGYSNATFKNITSTLNTVSTQSDGYYNGGFVGYASNATMTNCKSEASITSGNNVGGFIGLVVNGITATDCYSVGDVVATDSTSYSPVVGGFIGRGEGSINLTKCGTISNVTAKADSQGRSFAGGLIGYLHNDNTTKTITNCFAVGDVTATGSYVGGLVGLSWQANIDNSYYSGKLTGTNYAGGIIGAGSTNTLSKNYANGSISATQNVGGIAGNINTSSSIKSCVAAQDVINATNGTIGRVYGAIDATSSVGTPGTNEANRGMTTMNVVSQGQQLTVEDGEQHGTSVGKGLLKYKSTYQGINWDFSTNWTILETESYPYKPSQCAPPVFTGSLVAGSTSVSGKCASGASVFVIYNGNTYQANVSGTTWTVTVPAMQSGATIKAYAVTEELIQSYFVTATVGFEGAGTEDNPFLIYTADDLAGINSYSYYKVMNDIDLTSWINANSPSAGWVPVGKTGGGTMCQLDGDGHTISGLWTNSTGNNTGLISSIENATIKNLTINVANGKMVKGSGDYVGIVVGKSTGSTFENVTVQGNVSGANYVASIAGYADGGTFENVTAQGNASGGNYVASITGYADGGTFTNCHANGGQITATGGYVGGITGYATNATFTDCSAKNITGSSKGNYLAGIDAYAVNSTFIGCTVENMSVSTNNGGHVGGIAGYTDNNQFNDCQIKGSSFTGTGSYAGGIAAGSVNNSTFENCSVTGTTIGGASYVGGITGQIANPLTDIKIKSTIINATGNYVGGIVGKTTKAITNSYADVTLTGKDYIGGIAGHTSANIEICYSQGSVETTDLTNCRAGGIVGYTTGNTTNCYSTANTRGGQYAGGIAGYSFGAIAKCYSSGDLYATKFGAGIVGYLDGTSASVNNCFAINNKIDVSDQNGVAMRVIGGFKNGAATPQSNNYALKSMVVSVNDVTQQIYDDLLHGIGVTQNVLETQATYTAQGWDFTDTWGIDEGNGYPYLLALVEEETPEFTPGDVNDDGTINVSDYVATASYILEQDPQPFIFAAADLDGNNDITVSDLVGVAYLALTYEGAPMLAPAIAMTEAPSIAMAAEVNRLDNNIYEVAINMSNNIALTAMQMDLNLPQGMTLVDATLSDRASASHQVAFNQLNNGDYRLLSSSPACKSFKGNNGTVLTLTLKGTPSSNGGLRNIQLASPRAEGYSIDDLELNFSPTGVDYVTTSARIYSEGGNIVIVSPNDGTAQIVLPNGMSKTVNVSVGSNVYEAPAKGIVIVKMGNEIKKMRF